MINPKVIETTERLMNTSKKERREPVLQLEVNITPTKLGRILVYEGDKPGFLAMQFCRIHSINSEKFVALKQIIEKAFEQNNMAFEPEEPD